MHLFYEICPVVLFFSAFKMHDIYVATVVGIVSTFLQVILTRLYTKKWDNKQLITLSVFLVFGGMTLYFHNPIFIKWKPTVVFWVFSIALIVSQLFTQKPLIQRLMEGMFENKQIPKNVWTKLNVVWTLFFIVLGTINLYVAYQFSNDAWVNFKLYGVTSSLIAISLFQALYLLRYMTESTVNNGK